MRPAAKPRVKLRPARNSGFASLLLPLSHPHYREARTLRGRAGEPTFVRRGARRPWRLLVTRAAKVAYTFVMMNYAAVAGLFAAARGRRIWR